MLSGWFGRAAIDEDSMGKAQPDEGNDESGGNEATTESLRHALDMHRRNIGCFRGEARLRFQLEIDRIEKLLAGLKKKDRRPSRG
jgi:hypothetical protein